MAAGSIEIEEAVVAAKAAAAQAVEAANNKISALELQLRQITEAAMKNSDSADAQAPPRAVRHRLPAERASVTHKFGLAGHEGYITVGLYPNGQPGEIFIRMAKEGSTVSGLMDSFATAVSLALQHGVPLRVLCEKFAHTRFEPSGWAGNEQIGYAKSIMDYIFRWIQIRFLSGHQLDLFAGLGPQASVPVEGTVTAPANTVNLSASASSAAPLLSSRSEVEDLLLVTTATSTPTPPRHPSRESPPTLAPAAASTPQSRPSKTAASTTPLTP